MVIYKIIRKATSVQSSIQLYIATNYSVVDPDNCQTLVHGETVWQVHKSTKSSSSAEGLSLQK